MADVPRGAEETVARTRVQVGCRTRPRERQTTSIGPLLNLVPSDVRYYGMFDTNLEY